MSKYTVIFNRFVMDVPFLALRRIQAPEGLTEQEILAREKLPSGRVLHGWPLCVGEEADRGPDVTA